MTTLALAGCGLEDTGPSAFNPATNVDLTFSSFDLQNTEVAPDNLSYTRFWDFYRGIQPAAEGSDDLATTNEAVVTLRFLPAPRQPTPAPAMTACAIRWT